MRAGKTELRPEVRLDSLNFQSHNLASSTFLGENETGGAKSDIQICENNCPTTYSEKLPRTNNFLL